MISYEIEEKNNNNKIIYAKNTRLEDTEIIFNGYNNVLFMNDSSFLKNSKITFFGNNNIVFTGKSTHKYPIKIHLECFNDSVAYLGGNVFYNQALKVMLTEQKHFILGRDSLISFGVQVRTSDAHLIYDNKSKKRINLAKSVMIGDKVWLAQDILFLKGTVVGSGAIIGARSVVSGAFESNTIVAGCPARTINTGVFWEGNSTHSYTEKDTDFFLERNIEDTIFEPDNSTISFATLDRLLSKLDPIKSQQTLNRLSILINLDLLGKNRFAIANSQINNDLENEKELLIENCSELKPFFYKPNIEEAIQTALRNEQDKIYINTYSEESLLNLARKCPLHMRAYKRLLSADYILDGHKNKESHFIQRKTFIENITELDKFKNILYKLEDIPENKQNPNTKKNLVVAFSGMPGKDYDSESALHRMFTPMFSDIQRSLVKNTYILRIADLNLSHGSYYLNTKNAHQIEDEIQQLITHIADEKCVSFDSIILYGASKGGAGALYHGLLGGYNIIAADPILDNTAYINKNDLHVQEGFREIDLIPSINLLLKRVKRQVVIIGNSYVPYTWNQYSRLEKTNEVVIVDINNPKINDHPSISPHSVPEVLMYMNKFLLQI